VARRHEVVIIGGGHNGLTVAAYLAKAGVDVCVVEALDHTGGGVISPESVAPGFRTDICSVWHGVIQANPLLRHDELGLVSDFGLRYLTADNQLGVLFPDDSHLNFYRDVERTSQSIARFSKKDADAYRRFAEVVAEPAAMLMDGLFNPPPPFEVIAAMLTQNPKGHLLANWLPASIVDVLDEWFESDQLKAALTKFCAQAGVSPVTKGTGMVALFFVPLVHTFGGAMPEGGSGALSEAMERCIRHYGGTILTGSAVERVTVSNGHAAGVVLAGGQDILASRAVVSNLHARQIAPLVGAERLPPDFVAGLERLRRSSFGAISQAYALHEPPQYRAGDELSGAMFVEFAALPLAQLLRSFDDYEHGQIHTDMPTVACQTRLDPSRAPPGKHTLHLFHYAPFDPSPHGAASWDGLRDEVADRVLDALHRRTTNMGPDNIIARLVETPSDLARRNPAMIDGDYNHLGMFPEQQLGNRYLPGWGYRTPVDRLWMCGPSCHPGGGVTGGGRAAVQPIMEALGIDFGAVFGRGH
jgi:phytoene dehydrogenase-like protein